MNQEKIKVLSLIRKNKEILFGHFGENATNEKEMKWREITMYAKAFGLIDETKDWKYCKDVLWENWRQHTLCKIQDCRRYSSQIPLSRKLDEADIIILEILGCDTLGRFKVCKPQEPESTHARGKQLHVVENGTQTDPVRDSCELEIEVLKMKLEMLKREVYLKEMDIYKKEKELGLPLSKFSIQFRSHAEGGNQFLLDLL